MSRKTESDDPPTPIPNTYWIEPGRLLAGEYPGSHSRADTMDRLQRLLGAGVDHFIDLTEEGEVPEYAGFLPTAFAGERHIAHVRLPIRDHSVPTRESMREILEHLERVLETGHRVYLHCRAGIGRTGTVLGCLLVERGMQADDALRHLNKRWVANARSRQWPQTPETDEQVAFVRTWQAASEARGKSVLATARSLRERYHGALLGLAVGDALGATVQFRKPGSFTPLADLIGGGALDLPRGAWTDDAAMAWCLAESLIEQGSSDPADQMRRYQLWQRDGYLSSTGQCVGITAIVSRALATAQWSGKALAGSHDPSRLDKEALSRVAPAVLFHLADPEQAIEQAAEVARTTHQAPVVLDACRWFAALMVGALQGKTRQQLLAPGFEPVPGLWEARPLREPIASIAAGSVPRKAPPDITGGGNIVQCLEAVLWALERTSTFRDGVLLAVNLGLDSDVTGAVYGQLAGALFGVNGIPPNWRAALLKRDVIEGIADRLLAAALTGMPRPQR